LTSSGPLAQALQGWDKKRAGKTRESQIRGRKRKTQEEKKTKCEEEDRNKKGGPAGVVGGKLLRG